MKRKKSILEHIYNSVADVFYNLSIIFGTSNWGKTSEEMTKEMNDKTWYQVGLNLRQAYDNIANKYGYINEQ